MTLDEAYDAAIERGDIENDPAQRQILSSMQNLIGELTTRRRFSLPWNNRQTVKGLYLHGAVGGGKTFLMDMFFEHLPLQEKRRVHFHQFMQQVDARLRRLQGTKNPLQAIAEELANTSRVLCLDEFLVNDIADAMILAELLNTLFERGVVLVATSNTAPDDLYRNGVQRNRFLPAIAAIKANCEVLSLNEKRDYRLGRQISLETWLYPLTDDTMKKMADQFAMLEKNYQSDGLLTVQNRDIPYLCCGQQCIWFDFKVICNVPRSQLDYLEITNRFDTVFVSNIPALQERDIVYAVLLMHFVDVMYDSGMRLIFSAAIPLDELTMQGEIAQSFKRTLSRLQEMQSEDYLKRHRRRVEQLLC